MPASLGHLCSLVEIFRVVEVFHDNQFLGEAEIAVPTSLGVGGSFGNNGPCDFGFWVQFFLPYMS